MIDNDQNNEEYKLDDLDLLASEPEDHLQPEGDDVNSSLPPTEARAPFFETPVVRNGLIAIGILVLLLFCYELVSSFFSNNHAAHNDITPVSVNNKQLNTAPVMIDSTVKSFSEEHADPTEVNKKLASLAQEQNTMSSNILTINNQITTVTSSMSDVATKVDELSRMISLMNDKIEAESREIQRLVMKKAEKHPVGTRHFSNVNNQAVVYSLQAVIPGRAWLITNNGATLTVREGTSIAGYGTVKLIDPQQGRVITSSGKIIRFSQVDS